MIIEQNGECQSNFDLIISDKITSNYYRKQGLMELF